MRATMTRTMAIVACAVLGLCLGVQSSGQVLRANIPFAFHVRDTMMPAGEYEVRMNPATRSVVVSAMSGLTSAQFFGIMASSGTSLESCVVFHKYGNSYFLDRVKSSAAPFQVQAPDAKKEKEAERTARAYARAEVAEVRVPAAAPAR